jgi:hypothetical protein
MRWPLTKRKMKMNEAATERDAARYEQDIWLRDLFALIEAWRDTRDGTPSKAEAWSALWKHAHNIGPHWRSRAYLAGAQAEPIDGVKTVDEGQQ